MESTLIAQQKQDEYIKQLALKVDVLTTHSKTLKVQFTQKANLSYMSPDRFLSKPEPNPCEHCNCVNLKEEVEDFTDPKDIPMEEAREITMAGSMERNDTGKTTTFIENDTVEISTVFQPKLSD